MVALEPLPIVEAVETLSSTNLEAATLAARILGNAGVAAKKHGKQVAAVVAEIRQGWHEKAATSSYDWHLKDHTVLWAKAIWALGQMQQGDMEIQAALGAEDQRARVVRHAAIVAIGAGAGKAKDLLVEIESFDPIARMLAAEALLQRDPKAAAKAAHESLVDPQRDAPPARACCQSQRAQSHRCQGEYRPLSRRRPTLDGPPKKTSRA